MICCVRTPHRSLVAAWLEPPALRGRPLILGGLAHERGSVTTASIEARAQGVVEGMSLSQAQQFAPDAVFQPVDEEATARVRQSLLLTLHHFTPDVAAGEVPGCAFLRLDRLALRWPDRAQLLVAISRALDVAIHVRPAIGVALSMFVSKVAAERATAGAPVTVEPEQTRAYLARLPIDVLPLDDNLREYLELLGLKTIVRLQAISRPAFRRQFGLKALEIYDLALGSCHTEPAAPCCVHRPRGRWGELPGGPAGSTPPMSASRGCWFAAMVSRNRSPMRWLACRRSTGRRWCSVLRFAGTPRRCPITGFSGNPHDRAVDACPAGPGAHRCGWRPHPPRVGSRLAAGNARAQSLAHRLRLVAQSSLARVLAVADRRRPRPGVLLQPHQRGMVCRACL